MVWPAFPLSVCTKGANVTLPRILWNMNLLNIESIWPKILKKFFVVVNEKLRMFHEIEEVERVVQVSQGDNKKSKYFSFKI